MRGALLAAGVFAVASIALLGTLPMSIDEIGDVIETREASTARMIATLPLYSGAAPLWYLAERYTLQATGFSTRKARTISTLFAIATVLTVAFLASELGLRFGWVAAGLLAMFPQMLRYALEARVYSQALFFSVLATLLYVRLAKDPGWGRAGAFCVALLAGMYTQPYSGSIAIALLLWSLATREFRTVKFGAGAVGAAVAAFLPWYVWSKAGWDTGVVRQGFHFAASAKTPLLIFREVAGAGYWGSGLLAVLCIVAIAGAGLSSRTRILLLLLIAVPLVIIFTADVIGNYFIAARQFIWILPAIAILAATAFEHRPRAVECLAVALLAVCVRQDVVFFTAPRDDFQATARFLVHQVSQVHQNACVAFEPDRFAPYYEFFEPELERQRHECDAEWAVIAIAPESWQARLIPAVAGYEARGYIAESQTEIGRSGLVVLHHTLPLLQ